MLMDGICARFCLFLFIFYYYLKFVPILLLFLVRHLCMVYFKIWPSCYCLICLYFCPWLCGHIGRSFSTMDEVCNIFFFPVCSFLLVHSSRCAQEYYPQTSLSSLFWALWGPLLQKNNVVEGKPNQYAGESMESIVSSFLTWFKWGLPALKFLLAMFILKECALVAPTPKPSTVTIGILII